MLWDVVFEFFVKHVFGGRLGSGSSVVYYVTNNGPYFDGSSMPAFSNHLFDNIVTIYGYQVPIGNYYSYIATLITMVILVLLACLFIKKIYNMVAHVIA